MMENQDTIVNQITELYKIKDSLDQLAGEILATLKLNVELGHITFRNTEAQEVYQKLFDTWELRFRCTK